LDFLFSEEMPPRGSIGSLVAILTAIILYTSYEFNSCLVNDAKDTRFIHCFISAEPVQVLHSYVPLIHSSDPSESVDRKELTSAEVDNSLILSRSRPSPRNITVLSTWLNTSEKTVVIQSEMTSQQSQACSCRNAQVLWPQENKTIPDWRLFSCMPSSNLKVSSYSIAQDNNTRHCPLTLSGTAYRRPYSDRADHDPEDPALHSKCTRYIIADHASNGLGHRLGAVAMTANLANEFGFRLALGKGLWVAKVFHGNYSQFRIMLGLTQIPSQDELSFPPGANISRDIVRSREEFLGRYLDRYRFQCHLVVTALLGLRNSCRQLGGRSHYCFSAWPGAFSRARLFFQRAIRYTMPQSANETPHFREARNSRELVVAWHLRCGDIVLGASTNFFVNIRNKIAAAGVPSRDFLVRSNCSNFDYVQNILPSAVVVSGGVEEAMRHMSSADVLVHTGSSMAAAAGIVAASPQLYIHVAPKEGKGEPKETYAMAGLAVDGIGQEEDNQPFRYLASSAPSPGVRDAIMIQWQVARYVRAIHAYRYPGDGAGGPWAAEEARELDDLLGYKVLSGVLEGWTADEVQAWEQTAAMVKHFLPGWFVRIHYDSMHNGSLCRLRALSNVELVDMTASRLPLEWWPFSPALEGEAAIALFVSTGARLTVCRLERIAAWQGCGTTALPPRGGGTGCGESESEKKCEGKEDCVWGVRRAALGVVRRAVKCALKDARGPAAKGLRVGLIVDSAGKELVAINKC
jgi:hypothetical protein